MFHEHKSTSNVPVDILHWNHEHVIDLLETIRQTMFKWVIALQSPEAHHTVLNCELDSTWWIGNAQILGDDALTMPCTPRVHIIIVVYKLQLTPWPSIATWSWTFPKCQILISYESIDNSSSMNVLLRPTVSASPLITSLIKRSWNSSTSQENWNHEQLVRTGLLPCIPMVQWRYNWRQMSMNVSPCTTSNHSNDKVEWSCFHPIYQGFHSDLLAQRSIT